MRSTSNSYRIKWHGHDLTVEAHCGGGDVEILSIEGIDPVDMYFETLGRPVGDLETSISEAHAEMENDNPFEDHEYESRNGK